MSDQQNSAFGKFIPGFDFLQNLAKGASQAMPQIPNLSNWVAPTLNLEELEKRIAELKAVRFWLDQNSTALAATIQALEVQKMTLATLKGMNFNMAEMADALKLKPAADLRSNGAARSGEAASQGAAQAATKSGAQRKNAPAREAASAKVVDPLQWWGALTQQFQQIAATAMQDAAAAGTAGKAPAEPATSAAPARQKSGRKAPARARTKRPARKAAAG